MPPSIKTRILILSDTHAQRFSPVKDYQEAIQLLDNVNAPLKIAIAGNHEFSLDDAAYKHKIKETCRIRQEDISEAIMAEYGKFGEAKQLLLKAREKNIVFLEEGTHQLQLPHGAVLKLYVSPYTPAHNCGGWGFQYDGIHDFDIKQGADIVVTHGPPHGIMDMTLRKERIGCPQLFAAVARAQPRIHCFGHVHESWCAKLVPWRPNLSEIPRHFSDIYNDKSSMIENLARLTGSRPQRHYHCNPDGRPVQSGETMFVNAALMGVGRFDKVPWLVDIDLDQYQGVEHKEGMPDYTIRVDSRGKGKDKRKRKVGSCPDLPADGDMKRRRTYWKMSATTADHKDDIESVHTPSPCQDNEKQQPDTDTEVDTPYSSFTIWQKRLIVLAAATTALLSPMTAQIYFPALPAIAKDLGVTTSRISLTVTTYMIFQGITPMFIGSLADSGGRRPAYVVCFTIYIAANIGLALAPSYGALLGLRCLQSAGSASTVALCFAVVADVVTSAERGQYIGITAVPSVLGPSLGPVIGGLLAEYLGWRSIFWFLAIFSSVGLFLIVIFYPETCRHVVGDGSISPPLMYRSGLQILKLRRRRAESDKAGLSRQVSMASTSNKFKFKAPNVLESVLMLFEKETGLLLGFSSICFAGFYCIATAMPFLFADIYGFNEVQNGLMFLPIAAGSIIAAFIVGAFTNRNYKRHCDKLGIPYERSKQQDLSSFPIERARLEIGFPLLILAAVMVIGWGWAVDAKTNVAVPCVISALMGVGIVGFNNTTNSLLIDIHPGKPGTASAANNLTRCLVGAGASAAIIPMIDAMGVGWAFTLVGGLYILGCPILVVLMVRGTKWRQELKVQRERKDKANQAL
ncbi:dityrosine transporter [Fusarium langsethiae]|uniref:Dityrosine transporter n=1 Tax=Fusarium langsethiae TaxID=179993 RepID=A0A0N0DEH6_FUSLA|nr:dityrosine transporter [Fusarium langsethiae]